MIGVISDTHGLLRPEALDALRGAEHILHAGDVGDITILDRLGEIAPVTAIRGNIDTTGPTAKLPLPKRSSSTAGSSTCCTQSPTSTSNPRRPGSPS